MPEIYYLAVDKRNQMHIGERHMVSEYMLMYFIHKYVSENQIDLKAMWGGDKRITNESRVYYRIR